ncbi:MAG: hypothetical protein AB1763_02770 [Campylobacterota bacterium]
MAVGPIGNAIYVNQQMAAVASEKTAVLNRFELQTLAAAAASQEARKEVEEVRPPEENHGVDPDREHTREQADEEQRRSESEEGSEEEKPEPEKPLHLLDIKV